MSKRRNLTLEITRAIPDHTRAGVACCEGFLHVRAATDCDFRNCVVFPIIFKCRVFSTAKDIQLNVIKDQINKKKSNLRGKTQNIWDVFTKKMTQND